MENEKECIDFIWIILSILEKHLLLLMQIWTQGNICSLNAALIIFAVLITECSSWELWWTLPCISIKLFSFTDSKNFLQYVQRSVALCADFKWQSELIKKFYKSQQWMFSTKQLWVNPLFQFKICWSMVSTSKSCH